MKGQRRGSGGSEPSEGGSSDKNGTTTAPFCPNAQFVRSICAQFEEHAKDGDGTGQIALKKLKIVMRALGLEPRQAEVDEVKRKLLQNATERQTNPDSFTAAELANLLADRLKDSAADGGDGELRSVFRLFDTDAKGFISVADLRRVAEELGERISEEELKEMVSVAASSSSSAVGSDRVSETEFRAIMKKISLY
ncbi:hypothetical protein niasHT_035524 [Heterodera trifolii]|uniref:EF-hand domain-containing protein n=1 Tax=Heterodera trifolii TaxID=157864 RepID=A0ABD2IIB1_9BILA